MCGGVRFSYDPAYEAELCATYSSAQLSQFRDSGQVESLFWQARPVLPVQIDHTIMIIDWGNRQKDLRLPQTGWVRQESLAAGKWNYLRPRPIVIPALAGVEQKIWFGIEHGIQGILVRYGTVERVYMLTQAPSAAFAELTGHDRMPVLINQQQITPLTPSIG